MADISFNIVCKELKIAQIAQLYQLFRLLHLIHIYGHGFYELSIMVMRENVNNDVSKDSPIRPIPKKKFPATTGEYIWLMLAPTHIYLKRFFFV